MGTRFLDLKANKASSRVSLGLVFGILSSTIIIAALMKLSVYFFVVLFGTWGLIYLFSNGDFVTSRRGVLFSFRQTRMTPNFKDKKCLYTQMQDLPNLKGIMLQTDNIESRNNDGDEDWEKYTLE